MKKITSMLLALVIIHSASANNIQVTNVTVQPATNTIQFTVTWDNGWRSSILNNWDAAWVFIKYYNPMAPGWVHLNLSSTGNTIPAGFAGTIPADNIGIFLYRSAVGSGITTISNIQLTIPSQQASGIFDIKIFALEMVYVPQAPFYAGDAFSGGGRYGGTSGQNTPGFISASSGTGVYDPLATGGGMLNIPASFGNGFNPFYCMKYELTQGAYRDFLNCLTYPQQLNHTATAPVTGGCALGCTNRNYIKTVSPGTSPSLPAVYGCDANGNGFYNEGTDGEWLPCNFLTWGDHAAYLDWSGLRPITELEYEKACRGILLPVAGEFAWGGFAIHQFLYTRAFTYQAEEAVTNASTEVYGNAVYASTSGQSASDGPLRNGIFATTTSNRVSSGGSFYGIMEMSGNLYERVVTTAGNEVNIFIAGQHGDGTLDADGWAFIVGSTAWPGSTVNGFINGTVNATGLILRGGNWSSPEGLLRTSYRQSTQLITTTDMIRNAYTGVRGGRTAL